MNIARIFAHAFVRRIAAVLAILVLGWIGIGRAEATTKAEAYDAAASRQAIWNTSCPTGYGSGAYIVNFTITDSPGEKKFYAEADCKRMEGTPPVEVQKAHFTSGHSYDVACASGTVYVRASDSCVNAQERCLAKNADLPQSNAIASGVSQCIDGCTYGGGPGVGTTNGAIMYGPVKFTGATCPTNTPNPVDPNTANNNVCIPGNGGVSICVKPNGDHCYSASTGRYICWKTGETGTKTDGPVVQTRNPGLNNPAPAPTPPSGETLNGPSPNTNTTTNQPGGTTTNTTVNNYTTNYGTNGGPTNNGEPSDGSGGDGDDDDSLGGVGGDTTFARPAGAAGRSASSIVGAFKTRVQGAPVITAAQNFFTVQVSGSCPVWTIPETAYTPAVLMDYWCLSEFSILWDIVGAVSLIVFSWAAFRFAVL